MQTHGVQVTEPTTDHYDQLLGAFDEMGHAISVDCDICYELRS